jgi:hypothetical protein
MAVTLILGGAVGAMAFGAVMVFVSPPQRPGRLSLGLLPRLHVPDLLLDSEVGRAGRDARHAFPRRVPRRAPPRPVAALAPRSRSPRRPRPPRR